MLSRFPPRMLALLQKMAAGAQHEANGGPWQYADGTPMQEDALEALQWIGVAPGAPPSLGVCTLFASSDNLGRQSDSSKVTNAMLDAAMKRAIELGLCPKHAEVMPLANMMLLLEAAQKAAPNPSLAVAETNQGA